MESTSSTGNDVGSHRKGVIENGTASDTKTQSASIAAEAKQQPQESKHSTEDQSEPPTKKIKLDDRDRNGNNQIKGVAMIKKEYLLDPSSESAPRRSMPDDDAAEGNTAAPRVDDRDSGNKNKKRKFTKEQRKQRQGQNTNRKFFDPSEKETPLCRRAVLLPEFKIKDCCDFPRCREIHDLREYFGKRTNLIEDAICPVFKVKGWCPSGWKCLWVKSHMEEVAVLGDSDAEKKMELRLVKADTMDVNSSKNGENDTTTPEVCNEITQDQKHMLFKRTFDFKKSDFAIDAVAPTAEERGEVRHDKEGEDENEDQDAEAKKEHRATFKDSVLKASEKRRLHISASTPLLAPLTTTGNLPFRRLCQSLGAGITYSEMAMSTALLKGEKVEWARIRSHASESHFGAQIEASKPWQAIKATEVLAKFCPSLHLIDLNCGCPLDMVYRAGGGSGLLDGGGKLFRMVEGMNYVSGDIPITVKLRTGVKDGRPLAHKLITRLMKETQAAAITLHGRTRQQRYTRSADWEYIAECSSLIKDLKKSMNMEVDTSADDKEKSEAREPFFIGNGDCYSHADYYRDIEESGCDSVMIARGALIKPWIFEEIHSRQYLDKTATERLAYVEQFAKNGLEYWGSDEMGVNTTRRFLCEFLSFTHRYVPVGILEVLPPRLQDRPPLWRGRNELETLLASEDSRDWVKISEMFLGKTANSFNFVPKHKSHSYESIEAEG